MNLKEQVLQRMERLDSVVMLRSDVAHLGSTSHVTRVLAALVAERRLVRVSVGVYAKTKLNKFTGTLTPAAPFETIAAETFKRLAIDVMPGRLAREYNAGTTTQIPMNGAVSTGARRITRKIRVGSKSVKYER